MIMPGRSWVAGIAMAGSDLLAGLRPTLSEAEGLPEPAKGPKGQTDIAAALSLTSVFYKTWPNLGIQGGCTIIISPLQTARILSSESKHETY